MNSPTNIWIHMDHFDPFCTIKKTKHGKIQQFVSQVPIVRKNKAPTEFRSLHRIFEITVNERHVADTINLSPSF